MQGKCVITGFDKENQQPIVDIYVPGIGVKDCRKQYSYIAALWDRQRQENGEQPCEELEGLCNLLEAMGDLIEDATKGTRLPETLGGVVLMVPLQFPHTFDQYEKWENAIMNLPYVVSAGMVSDARGCMEVTIEEVSTLEELLEMEGEIKKIIKGEPRLTSTEQRSRWYVHKEGSGKSWKIKYRFSLEAALKLAKEMEATQIIHVTEETLKVEV